MGPPASRLAAVHADSHSKPSTLHIEQMGTRAKRACPVFSSEVRSTSDEALAASDPADVVREADEEEHQHERDADRREAFVHLPWDRPAAHRLEQRQKDV